MDPSPARPRLGRRLLVGALSFIVVAGVVAAGVTAFRFVRGAGDRLASLAPDDTLVYATAYLDPPAPQKLAAGNLLDKFPQVSSSSALDAAVNRLLDRALAGSGLGHQDVRSWLGTQVAAAVSSQPPDGSGTMAGAALVNSSDDSRARAALKRYEAGAEGKRYTWTSENHDGVALDVGKSAGGEQFVWGVVDGTVILSNSVKYTDEIVRTAHGAHAALTGTGDYTKALGQLPADKLAFVYVDVPRFAGLAGAKGHGSPLGELTPGFGSLAAYHGTALALTAQAGGVSIDGVVDYDMSKMTQAQRDSLQVAPDVNRTLGFVPAHAYGLYALNGLPKLVRALLDSLGTSNTGGFAGIATLFLEHLTGDAAIEVDRLDGQSLPAVGVLLAADSDASAQRLLGNLVHTVCGFGGSCDASKTQTQTYRGTTISTLALGGDARLTLSPSWAVKDGMGILASTPDEVKAVLDAHAGSGVRTARRFTDVLHPGDLSNNALLYLDVSAVSSAVRGALPAADRTRFDADVAPYLDHFTSLLETTTNGADRSDVHVFIAVR